MKKATLLFLFPLLLMACNNANKAEEATLGHKTLITNQSVGPFELGEAIPDSLRTFNFNKTIQEQYTESGLSKTPVYTVSKDGALLLTVFPKFNNKTSSYTKTIDEIMIHSSTFITKKGIGVGSSIDAFITTYPNYKLWYTYVSNRYVLENEYADIQFLLKEEDFIGNIGPLQSEITKLEPSDFKDQTTIYKIRIY